MQFRHKRTGKIYTKLHNSFSVERQAHSVVYMNAEGQIFDRDAKIFSANFEFVRATQSDIVPHGHKTKEINLSFDMNGSDEHPETVMLRLGILYQASESCPMGDKWFFYNCSRIPEGLPDFIKETEKQKEFSGSFLNGLSGIARP